MSQDIIERVNELMKKVPVQEDNYWIFFGHGKGWGNKCDRCIKHVEENRTPGKEAVNCWKFEIWTDNLTDVLKTFLYLLEECEKDPTLHGKIMKSPALIYESGEGRLGSGISHSYPEEAKPDRYLNGEIQGDRVILIYNQSVGERNERMEKIIGDLKRMGLYKKETAPYRRGCIQPHESIIGPWEKWHDMDKDYIEE